MASRIEAIAVELAHCRSPKVLKSKLLSLKKAVKDIEETEDREKYIAAAKQKYLGDNEVEIDSDAVVSKGEDHGAFVSAWVWVEDTWTKEGRTMVRITFT